MICYVKKTNKKRENNIFFVSEKKVSSRNWTKKNTLELDRHFDLVLGRLCWRDRVARDLCDNGVEIEKQRQFRQKKNTTIN